ncbi:MAG: isochorismatase family protein [Verrucomicrobia bacterium]|nr:isochorismatase family protein [Verrucomicrobiota bacterium]
MRNDPLNTSRHETPSKRRSLIPWLLLILLLIPPLRAAEPRVDPRILELQLQRRDPQSGVVSATTERVASTNVAIVMIDFWNYHWCATWVGRAGVMIPRMNQALVEARKLGMTIVHAPTDCSSGHAGTPQREAMAGLTPCPLPKPSDFNPPAPWGLGFSGGCMCGGPYPCYANYGWTREDPRLIIADTDFVSSGPRELNNLCVARGIKHIIYCGGAANMCLLQKQEAMLAMIRHGYNCMLARDITEAMSEFTAPGSADRATEASVEYIEKLIGPSIHLIEELRKAGYWDEQVLVDAPILVPWGFKMRPKFFDTTLSVFLSVPRLPGAEIRFTTDGSDPTAQSSLYAAPLILKETSTLRAVPFRDGRPVGLESEGYFVRMPPKPPPPDVFISDLKPLKMNMAIWSEWYAEPSRPDPRPDGAYDGGPLRLRFVDYKKGMGLRAPSHLIYELKPEFDRFVARVGVDEGLLKNDMGRERAMYPHVVFKVVIDGRIAAESPVMRITQEPWRFDVPIPAGSRVISLAAAHVGEFNPGELVQWVDAGFTLKPGAKEKTTDNRHPAVSHGRDAGDRTEQVKKEH